ncbi:ABC transporter substrate-binding protein [Caldimonas brevitalea]|uniref:TetR family transcriptional regulator n=1 Tax=Caldimonas brevitalea TaxID=413882 RepID=A0A0G3BJ51_9BURK|nr:ABC transporter substrate-binding protein [Caldimonas brevitalea]AKJ29397.1 TetR family transcriptional regulator [Caldimonas brevitalea]
MTRRPFLTRLLQAAIALTALPLLPTLAQAQDKPTVIRIAYSGAGTGGRPLAGGNILATAHQRGTLEEEFRADGIRIQWNFFPGAGPATNEAAANGLVDFAHHGDLPLIVGKSTGLPRKVILALGRFGNTYFVVPSDSQAKTLADLKGKRIAVNKGTAGQLTLARVLERHGFTEKDFRVISMDAETAKASLATRDIDGYITTPFDLQARGIARPLFEIKRDPKVTSVTSFWVTEEFEKKYPQIVQRVVNALVKTAVWSSDEQNRDPQFKLWGQAGSTPYGDYVKTWEGYTLRDRNSPLLDEYYLASIQKAIDEAKRFRLIRRDVPLAGWIEPKYVNQALKDLKLEGHWPEFDVDGNPKQRDVAKVAAP